MLVLTCEIPSLSFKSTVEALPSMGLVEVKKKLNESMPNPISNLDDWGLCFNGEWLDEANTVEEAGLQSGTVLHLIEDTQDENNANDDDLPPGWVKMTTDEGYCYYGNEYTGDTTWEKPTEPAKPAEEGEAAEATQLKAPTGPLPPTPAMQELSLDANPAPNSSTSSTPSQQPGSDLSFDMSLPSPAGPTPGSNRSSSTAAAPPPLELDMSLPSPSSPVVMSPVHGLNTPSAPGARQIPPEALHAPPKLDASGFDRGHAWNADGMLLPHPGNALLHTIKQEQSQHLAAIAGMSKQEKENLLNETKRMKAANQELPRLHQTFVMTLQVNKMEPAKQQQLHIQLKQMLLCGRATDISQSQLSYLAYLDHRAAKKIEQSPPPPMPPAVYQSVGATMNSPNPQGPPGGPGGNPPMPMPQQSPGMPMNAYQSQAPGNPPMPMPQGGPAMPMNAYQSQGPQMAMPPPPPGVEPDVVQKVSQLAPPKRQQLYQNLLQMQQSGRGLTPQQNQFFIYLHHSFTGQMPPPPPQ
eukprot:GCRY01001737.1.p1 GENE.GCRY01001737.1~~GCRY01001737.1.p1  ORF type:complete len:523 (+),score=156.95 GCRY01001737.1:159-1727(+)